MTPAASPGRAAAGTGSGSELERADIQGLLAAGYGHLPRARYVLLGITAADRARRWLGTTAEVLTTAASGRSTWAANLALTASGLARLGLSDAALGQFPDELITGMTTPHRSRILGDVDDAAPGHWRWGGPATAAVDAIVLLYGEDDDALDEVGRRVLGDVEASGLDVVHTLETAELSDREHFGFRDGISQPVVDGLRRASAGPVADDGSPTVAAGEFVLGYRNGYGRLTGRPLVAAADDAASLLPADVEGSGGHDLGRNGSYLVFRQLHQDVAAFRAYVAAASAAPDGRPDPGAARLLAARMVGRWPSGAPLVQTPDADDPRLGDVNDFAYHDDDEAGLRCPLGAHVRRANPRDMLGPDAGSATAVELADRHRLLRRGRGYGPPLPDDDAAEEPGVERGLHFICCNANIARQFEFVSHTWLGNPRFAGLYDDRDPLVGVSTAEGTTTFTEQARPLRRRHVDVPRFVTVRGGAYTFLPGIRALRYLASLGPEEAQP